MPAIFTAILLMAFLLWGYNTLNRSINKNADASTTIKGMAPIKVLFTVTTVFLACYLFVVIAKGPEKPETKPNTVYQVEPKEHTYDQQFNVANDKTKSIRVLQPDSINTKFSQVAGLSEAKDEVQDIIKFLQNPEDFGRLGAKSPKGMLLYGEPGTGKTLLARAIAGESNVAFIAVSGSEFEEEYVGVGAARVRQLFETARQNAPCIIFIDEIDALAHKRQSNDPAWLAQTVNQLLAEMDGLDETQNIGIVVIGASNRIGSIDPAVLRPGRLDRHIKLDIPTLSEREQVVNIYLDKIKVDSKVKANAIARMTTGFSSAELANLVNEAAISATKKGKKSVEMIDFDIAKDRIILGSQRDSMNVSANTRKVTAYHEAGHALIGQLLGGDNQPLYKVTITPRGPTLGHTSFEPSKEEYSLTLQQVEALITTQLAGRVAEELVFGEQNMTTGAENDLKNATQLAYNMVTKWGYSKRLGPVYLSQNLDFVSSEIIEQEVQEILNRNYARAKELLTANRAKLDGIANGLLEHETLDVKQVKAIMEKN